MKPHLSCHYKLDLKKKTRPRIPIRLLITVNYFTTLNYEKCSVTFRKTKNIIKIVQSEIANDCTFRFNFCLLIVYFLICFVWYIIYAK